MVVLTPEEIQLEIYPKKAMTDQSYDSTKIYIENYQVYQVYSQKMSDGCVDDC